MMRQECDYCGTPGCHWQRHPQARADVAAWQRELAAIEATG
jgi:hypothetical protein